MVDAIDASWAAGFFDGEGSTGFYPYKQRGRQYYRIIMGISQIDSEVLKKMQSILGGTVRGPYKQKRANHSDIYHWRIQNLKDVEVAYDIMRPFLGSVKRNQAEEAIKKMKDSGRVVS